jgi:hypothetical protein
MLALFFANTATGQAQTAPAIEWQRSLGGTELDYANSVRQTIDGGYVMAGVTYSNNGDVFGNHGGSDMWVVKLDHNGAVEWQHAYGGSGHDHGYSIWQTSEGGYVVAGETLSTDGDVLGNHGQWDVWVVKLDPMGVIEWARTYGGSASDYARSIQQTADGGYIVGAETRSSDGDVSGIHVGPDFWALKLDANGGIQWQRCLGGSGYDGSTTTIQQTMDGGYITCESSTSDDGDLTENHGAFDYWVAKLDSAGGIQWQRALGGSSDDYASNIAQTADGGFAVIGQTDSNDGDVTGYHGDTDYWLVKLDAAGGIQWQQCYGGTGLDQGSDVLEVTGGGYLVSGATESMDGDVTNYHGERDAWLVRLDSEGTLLWQKTIGGSSHDAALAIVPADQAGYIMAGASYSNDGDVSGNHGEQDCWVVKLGPDNVGIAEPEGPRVFSLYPNPARDVLNVHLGPGAPAAAQIKLLAADGRCLRTWPGGQAAATDLALPVGQLPTGVYAVQISTAERSWAQRFVKP